MTLEVSRKVAIQLERLRKKAGYNSVSHLVESASAWFDAAAFSVDPEEVTRVLHAAVLAERRTGERFLSNVAALWFTALCVNLNGECQPGSLAAEVCEVYAEAFKDTVTNAELFPRPKLSGS